MSAHSSSSTGSAAPLRTASSTDRNLAWLAALALLVGSFLIYGRSLEAPFFFDDEPAIVGNPTLRQLWPPWSALQPPDDGAGVTGRPLTNLSFAFNYAISGLNPRSYRATNVVLHAAVAWLLFLIVRRTARLPFFSNQWHERANQLGLITALAWAAHPVLSESVICVVQRNEVLVAGFYLLTFYSVLRVAAATERIARMRWGIVTIAAAFLGVASKEVMATAPLLLVVFDRSFLAGSFRSALKERGWIYGGLALSWGLLAWLMFGTGQRAGTVGFGLGISSFDYLLTQCRAVVMYLKLVFWPSPLVADYGTPVVAHIGAVAWQATLLVVLFTASMWGIFRRRSVIAFLGLAFFIILAPSSSVVPLTTQTVAEHRMYLPLATIIPGLVLGLHSVTSRRLMIAIATIVIVGWSTLTARRGADYTSVATIWEDVLAKAPDNARAHLNRAKLRLLEGKLAEARADYDDALRLKPRYAEAAYGLGLVASREGKPAEALARYDEALQFNPTYTAVRNDRAIALAQLNRRDEALRELDTVIAAEPQNVDARINRGNLFLEQRRWENATADFASALQVNRNATPAWVALGRISLATNLPNAAIEPLSHAVELAPQSADIRAMLATALLQAGRRQEGLAAYQAALALAPSSPDLHFSTALALAANGRLAEAAQTCEEALRLRPNFPEARQILAQLRADLGKLSR